MVRSVQATDARDKIGALACVGGAARAGLCCVGTAAHTEGALSTMRAAGGVDSGPLSDAGLHSTLDVTLGLVADKQFVDDTKLLLLSVYALVISGTHNDSDNYIYNTTAPIV